MGVSVCGVVEAHATALNKLELLSKHIAKKDSQRYVSNSAVFVSHKPHVSVSVLCD